ARIWRIRGGGAAARGLGARTRGAGARVDRGLRRRRRPRHPRLPEVVDVDASLADRLATVDGQIADAARAAGRDPRELTRIVVTKFHPVPLIRELATLGVRDFGEN